MGQDRSSHRPLTSTKMSTTQEIIQRLVFLIRQDPEVLTYYEEALEAHVAGRPIPPRNVPDSALLQEIDLGLDELAAATSASDDESTVGQVH